MPERHASLVHGVGGSGERAQAGGWILAAAGVGAIVAAALLDPSAARSAAGQVWSPFVLVTGLLLVGMVADQDGLFAAIGHRLAAVAPNGTVLFAGATVVIATVTALLNLDTSVVFLTPVIVHAGRRRGQGETALLIACILLSNAGSLLLPGSNLTNLIVLGHLHLSGAQFFSHMALPWLASALVTAGVVAIAERRSLRPSDRAVGVRAGVPPPTASTVTSAVGAVAVAVVTVMVVVLRSPALPVAAVGLLVVTVRLASGRVGGDEVRKVVGVPVLIGLFGVATALGTLGRSWSGPATLLSHLDSAGTALVGALASVVVNNLPAASLLAARVPPHPFALLVGLDIGPNLFVTGSLAWILWLRTVRATGATPPVSRAVVLGLVTAPLSAAAALALLSLTGVG
jgi:arsenical pump membrane protein